MEINNIIIGCTLTFVRNPEEYTVKACDSRFVICTRPGRTTPEYTIIDLEKNIRGPHNFLFSKYDFSRQGYIDKLLFDLNHEFGGVKISEQSKIPLDITSIKYPNKS